MTSAFDDVIVTECIVSAWFVGNVEYDNQYGQSTIPVEGKKLLPVFLNKLHPPLLEYQ